MSTENPMAPCVAFLLDAPMQSWGTASRFQRRGTNHHPSKSAIAGIIAAAMGLAKGSQAERETLADITELRLISILIPRTPRRGRTVPPQRLLDYHTVGGGFDKKADPLSIPRKAKGGPGDNATVTSREYLTDVRFGVVLKSRERDNALLDRIRDALLNPIWGIWLGRKCCLPAEPLNPCVFDSEAGALDDLLARAGFGGHQIEAFEREIETDDPATADAVFNDQPVAFGTGISSGSVGRKFGLRGVRLYRPRRD